MTGEPEVLVDAAMYLHGLSSQHALLLRRVLLFLLREELIVSDLELGRAWQSSIGTGMGLVHSGSLADLALLNLAERRFAALPDVRIRLQIPLFCRFKDDGLFVGHDKFLAQTFFWEYMALSRPFEVVCEDVSSSSVVFLDTRVTLAQSGHFVISPHLKDTILSTPLSIQSGHPPHIHHNWPRAHASRILNHCGNVVLWRQFRDELVLRSFKNFAISFATIVQNISVQFPSGGRMSDHNTTKPRSSELTVWMPLLYHHAWALPLQKVISRINRDPCWYLLLADAGLPRFTIRIAWRLPYRNHEVSVCRPYWVSR